MTAQTKNYLFSADCEKMFAILPDQPENIRAVIAEIEEEIQIGTIFERRMIAARMFDFYKTKDPFYSRAGGFFATLAVDEEAPKTFLQSIALLAADGQIRQSIADFVLSSPELNAMIDSSADHHCTYFSAQTVVKQYLKRVDGKIAEKKQYIYLRTAVELFADPLHRADSLLAIERYYRELSAEKFTHSTPTLSNSCTVSPQLMSCFLFGVEDNAESILGGVTDVAKISKSAGGIGLHYSAIRGAGQKIRSTGGTASGTPAQLAVINSTVMCWDQGGRRPGACAIYMEPWHADIIEFLGLKMQQGYASSKTRDLFYAIWAPNLFFRRVKEKSSWSLFSPNTAPGLSDVYDGMEICVYCGDCQNVDYRQNAQRYYPGYCIEKASLCSHQYEERDVFTELYCRYEREGLAVKVVPATLLEEKIFASQRDNGTPYILSKDSANCCSGQKGIGTIKSSNLCAEIIEWSSSESYASCTLASINLPKFVRGGVVDWKGLQDCASTATEGLNRVIDRSFYVCEKIKENSISYRPIGLGVQGMYEFLLDLQVPFDSAEADELDAAVAETIYYGALKKSSELALQSGPYRGFYSSPASRGLLKFNLRDRYCKKIGIAGTIFSGRHDWGSLIAQITAGGLRNSLTTAWMPTVSTATVLGNTESFEAPHSNYYTKTTTSGKFTILNLRMIEHLHREKLWNDSVLRAMISADGSIAEISSIPAAIRALYKTVWEIKQTVLINRSARRSSFIDQSQSLNIYIRDNSDKFLRGVLFLGVKLGLTTISYYIRTQPASKATKYVLSLESGSAESGAECKIGCSSCSG